MTQGEIRGGQVRQFGDVRDAIAFVMEALPEGDRATATVQTDEGSLSIDDIEREYRELDKRGS